MSALRRLAPPGCKLMEWGHRLSFAYVAGYEDREAERFSLARHIVRTGGLLCSSCQVIFLDTDRPEEGEAFCQAFLPLLNQAARERNRDGAAQAALCTHTYRLERLAEGAGERTWFGEGCSLTWKPDRDLNSLPWYGNVLVKCLPRGELLPVLRRQKGRLQTAGLLCRAEEREELTALLARAGGNPDHPGGRDVPHLPWGGPRRGVFPAAVYTIGRHRNLNISPPGRGGGTKERVWN